MDMAILQESLEGLSGYEKEDAVLVFAHWLKNNPEMLVRLRTLIPEEGKVRAPRSDNSSRAKALEDVLVRKGYVTLRETNLMRVLDREIDTKTLNRIMQKIPSAIKFNGKHRDGSRVFYYHEDQDPTQWAAVPEAGPVNIAAEGHEAAQRFLERYATGSSVHWKNTVTKEKKFFIIDKGDFANVNLMLADWNARCLRPLMEANGWLGQANLYKKSNEEE